MGSWEDLGYIQLRVFIDKETGERYFSTKPITEWLLIVKKNKPELSDLIDFLIRQLNRDLHTVH